MKLTLMLLVSISCITLGTSKKCYVCSTFNKNETCADTFNKDVLREEICDVANHVCLKERISSMDGGRENLFRACVSPDYCHAPGRRQTSFCETCDTDLCNMASPSLRSLLVLPLLVIVRYFI